MLTDRWRLLQDRIIFFSAHCANIMSVSMKPHNCCVEQDAVIGRCSWDSVNDSFEPQERAKPDAVKDRFVQEVWELNHGVPDRFRDSIACTQSVPR